MSPIQKALREFVDLYRWSNLKTAYTAELAKVRAEQAAKKSGRKS